MAPPFLSARRPPMLGVDISTSAVKLVELGRKGNQYRVEGYAVESLPREAVDEDSIKEPEVVGEAIKRALKRSGSRCKLAAVALPSSAVITKVIAMPSSFSESDMETQIQLEADQYIPYPLDEVSIDFEVIGPSAASEDMVDVLLAASRSENVEMRVAALDVAGLTAKVVDVESYAVENAFGLLAGQIPEQGTGQLVAVADVGAAKTALHVLQDGKLLHTREQPFGGNQLIEDVMARYGLSFEEASRARRQGELPDDYRSELLAPFAERIAQEVFRSLQFFYSSSEHAQIQHIVLAGGCAAVPGVVEATAARTGVVGVSVANPFAGMAQGGKLKKADVAADAPSLLIACGLAMRSFD